MVKTSLGVVEGFFGPAWPLADRLSYAPLIEQSGGGFFIYAPKADPLLRKKWREPWDASYIEFLTRMIEKFQSHGVVFGVGLSPFGLGSELSDLDSELLREKLRILDGLGVTLLGLFFDDMPRTESLAKTQIHCVQEVLRTFGGQVVFCPSYYSFDPILDKVFGERPAGYLDEIAAGIPDEVSLAWTGPKVISPEITREHLREVSALLKREPFIWENIFANDGPKNCKFLKLKPLTGREEGIFEQVSGMAFNLMNQPKLSELLFLSSRLVLEERRDPEDAFNQVLQSRCGKALCEFLQTKRLDYLEKGLDGLSEERKSQDILELSRMKEPVANEIIDWLKGHYTVGSECLTD